MFERYFKGISFVQAKSVKFNEEPQKCALSPQSPLQDTPHDHSLNLYIYKEKRKEKYINFYILIFINYIFLFLLLLKQKKTFKFISFLLV